MKNLFLILIILIIFSGCKIFKPEMVYRNVEIHDSIKELIRDTLIKSNPDTASIKALMRCDSLGNVYISELNDYKTGNKIKVKTEFKDRWFSVKCIVDSQKIWLKLKDRYKAVFNDSTTVKIKEVNILTSYQKFAVKWFTLSIIFLVVFGILFVIYLVKFRK
jgi:hypothetical protein